tara:strand:+ start:1148 stop:1717 length:570 start_codon:yes stop_codon:yes gene_type:complete
MNYDKNLWNLYTKENLETEQKKLGDFIYHLTLGLGAKKICEVGTNVGNTLIGFPKTFDVTGVDLNQYALSVNKEKHEEFKFDLASALELPYSDNSFDLVFTRGVLIHINPTDIDKVIDELFRVSKKWIVSLEYFGEDSKTISWKRGDNLLWYRDMKTKWKNYDVEIISDLEMPEKIDSGKTRLTVVKKS